MDEWSAPLSSTVKWAIPTRIRESKLEKHIAQLHVSGFFAQLHVFGFFQYVSMFQARQAVCFLELGGYPRIDDVRFGYQLLS